MIIKLNKQNMSKESINLPKTAFSMKANLPAKEPELVDHWIKINLYQPLIQRIQHITNFQ